MTEIVNAANAQAAKKSVRRGVSNSTRSVSRLKFHEKDAASNGLFIAQLNKVTVVTSVNAEGKMFSGLEMPKLVLEFNSCHSRNDEKRYVDKTILPVESNVNTIPRGKFEWQVNNVFSWIKHILDVFYLKGREFTETEENDLTLDFEDFSENEDGTIEYVPVEPEDVLKAYKKLFENVAAMLNGTYGVSADTTPKPVYKDANGNNIKVWIKLLRFIKNKDNDWKSIEKGGELAFPTFVGEGVMELVEGKNFPKIIKLNVLKESITPKEVKKAPSIGIPGAGMMPMGGYVDNGSMPSETPVNEAFAGAADDMPF